MDANVLEPRVVERLADYHLTVLVDRVDGGGGLILRLVDENKAELAAMIIADGDDEDDVAVEVALEVSERLGLPPGDAPGT